MRTRKFLLLPILFLLSTLVTKAQSLDAIIQKHIFAMGGADNWKKINSVKMTGSINAGGMEIPVTITTAQGKGQRLEFTVNGMTGYMIITPNTGWSYSPMEGQQKPEAMTADDVKESQDELDIQGALIDYKAKGHKVEYLGKDEVEGTECHKLKVTYASGKEETMFIDASNYYHIRSIQKAKVNGKEEEQISNYGNYQKLPEGVYWPMSVDDGSGPITLKTVEINKPVDENIFKPTTTSK